MKIENGNIVDQFGKHEIVLATTNSVIQNGHLIMGKGNAASINALTNSQFSKFAGDYLREKYANVWYKPYMLQYGFELPHSQAYIFKYDWANPKGHFLINNSVVGLLQVKYHYAHDAELALLQFSIEQLIAHVRRDPLCTIACPMPAIGAGNLPMEDVVRALLPVPNNVTFYML